MTANPSIQRVPIQRLCLGFTALLLLSACGMIYQMTGVTEAHALRQQGVQGQAVVRKLWDTGITLNDDPVVGMKVEVRRGGQPTYEAVIPRTLVSRLLIQQVQPGSRLPVWIDPADPSRVAVDPDAVSGLPPRD